MEASSSPKGKLNYHICVLSPAIQILGIQTSYRDREGGSEEFGKGGRRERKKERLKKEIRKKYVQLSAVDCNTTCLS